MGQALQRIISVTSIVLFLVGCSTHPTPTVTPVPPTLTPEPPAATIVGQITRSDEQPRVQWVIPCLIVEEDVCQAQGEAMTAVSDTGSFEIADVAPGTYTFLYGPAQAEATRALWENKPIRLDNQKAFAQSFDADAEPVGCRSLESTGERDEETGLYPITILDTVWVDMVSLQIDVPDGFEWKQGTVTLAGTGAPLQIEVMSGEKANITLRGLGCENE